MDAVTAQQPEPEADDLSVANLVTWVEDWEEATSDATKNSERDRDYYDHIQYTSAELKALHDRGQPDIVFNLIQQKIDYLIGYEATTRTDPRAFPRTPQDEDAAEAASDALRFVEDDAELDAKFSAVWENMLVEGYGGLELTVDEQGEIGAVEWQWDRLFYDPHSRKHDFSDARYLGGVIWMDAQQAQDQFPDGAEAIQASLDDDSGKTHEDRPKWKKWTTGDRKRVKIVQMYYKRAGQWHYCVFTKGGKLASYPVAFKDDKGRSWCPLFIQSAYVNRNNERYGFVRSMIGPQDEVNKRRSKSLHLLTVRQTKSERGAVDDVEHMKKELSKPDGHIEVNPGFEFEVLDRSQEIQGNWEMMGQAIEHIRNMGPNAALIGRPEGSASGRALQMNAQSGQTEIARLQDRHKSLKKRVYAAVWHLIRQYKNEEWWVRVTDDEQNVKFVGFNRPVTFREELQERFAKSGAPPEAIQAKVQELEMVRPDLMDTVVRTANVPAQMTVDITIEDVPDVANVQAEQFEQMVALAPAVTFPPEVYIEASSIRKKRQLLEKLKAQTENPQAQEMQARQAALALEELAAKVEKLKSEAIKNLAQADQADAQTGAIVNPAIVEPGGGGPPQIATQPQPNNPPQQAGF